MPEETQEAQACNPLPLSPNGFNPRAIIPCQLTILHIEKAMEEFLQFLGFINTQLLGNGIHRLESFMMPANFSSLVGEFMAAAIPKYCSTIVRNRFHNGHPDLLPEGTFPRNAAQHAPIGIEIKASRRMQGWQGHNAEDVWLLVFVFDSNTSALDKKTHNPQAPRPFRFIKVVGAQLAKGDWQFSGRSETSRRTITASVKRSGFEKMESNWIYRYQPGHPPPGRAT